MPDVEKEHYPSVHLSGEEDYNIPESGIMTVRFSRNSKTEIEMKDGKKRCDVSFDLLEILDIKPDKKAEMDESAEEALERLKKEGEY